MSNELIWFQDIQGFITKDNYSKFFPSKEMTFSEQLNSLMRFTIYFSVLMFVLRRDANILFIVIFMAGFTYLLYTVDSKNKRRERFYLDKQNLEKNKITKELCIKPTQNNPFMNVLVSDYANPQRKKACEINGKTKKLIKKYFDNNLYRDVSDIYNKKASDRNYYTTPITTIPNDQKAFADYCYGKSKTCKEGNSQKCYVNMYRPISN
jgi:hypothetical protein